MMNHLIYYIGSLCFPTAVWHVHFFVVSNCRGLYPFYILIVHFSRNQLYQLKCINIFLGSNNCSTLPYPTDTH